MKHGFASFVCRVSCVSSFCLGALALGCSGDDASLERRAALAGGWSNEDANLFVCFAEDGRMWLGDSRSEIGGASHCVADASGVSFECTDPDDGESFGGDIGNHGDELTLDLVPCPPDAEYHAAYVRDTALTCE